MFAAMAHQPSFTSHYQHSQSESVKMFIVAWTTSVRIFIPARVLVRHKLLLLCSSADRSFTPTHHSYYSPKHDGMMEELLTSQQVPDRPSTRVGSVNDKRCRQEMVEGATVVFPRFRPGFITGQRQ